MGKEVENLEIHGRPKNQYLIDEDMWTCSSYPFSHKTTFHCSDRRAEKFGNWICII